MMDKPTPTHETLTETARRVGRDWVEAPYYDGAEPHMAAQWQHLITPFLAAEETGIDFAVTVDLAAGHGRNSAQLLPLAQQLHIVDINAPNIEVCKRRFGSDPRIHYHVNDGFQLTMLPAGDVTLIYCFDAMVHFDSDVVRAYLREFARVLAPRGHAFLHHSNHTGHPGGNLHAHPAWRNFMSRELFAHYALKEGLEVVRQELVDWQHDGTNSDCFSLLRKPAG